MPRPLATVLRRTLRLASFGLRSHLANRTRVIDEAVRLATESGSKQLVILGAGLDARAHRLAELAETTVYEIDQPSTQSYKRDRAAELPVMAKDVRYVAVDFERDDLGERLGSAGHDAGALTTWIWEGVTPYLTREAVASTLSIVRSRSATGSELLMTYVTPSAVGDLTKPLFRLIREPLRWLAPPSEMHALAEEHDFDIVRDNAPTTMVSEHVLQLRAR